MKENQEKLFTSKKILSDYLPMAVAFIGIVVCGIVFQQQFIKIFPVCFSLLIGLFTAKANRISFLLGAANCLVYIIGYFSERLYGSALSTAFSAIIQISSFFMWKKHAYKQATEFRTLKQRWRVLLAVGVLVAWVITAFVLWKTGANEAVLDGLILVLGFVVPVMQMFALLDVLPFYVLNAIINVVMWVVIVAEGSLANLTYLISGVYTLYIVIRVVIKWIVLYKEQKGIK